jgi:hypothetical protein
MFLHGGQWGNRGAETIAEGRAEGMLVWLDGKQRLLRYS